MSAQHTPGPRYLVTWTVTNGIATRSRQGFYQGWAQQYGEPMWTPDRADALKMSRGGAYRVAARLRDPKQWGVPDARVEPIAKATRSAS